MASISAKKRLGILCVCLFLAFLIGVVVPLLIHESQGGIQESGMEILSP